MGSLSSTRLALVSLACLLGLVPGSWVRNQVSGVLLAQSERSAPASPPPAAQGSSAKSQALSPEERADLFLVRKSYADAVEYYMRALKQSGSSNPVLWNKLGIAYQQQTNYRAARKAYHQAIRHREEYAEAWNNIGTTYFMENKFKKSLKWYLRAMELGPNSAPFHLNLGTAYYRLKRYDEAMEELRAAFMLDPNLLTEHSTKGTTLQAPGADAEYFFYLAKVFASLGRPEDAVRCLRRALEDGLKDLKRLERDQDFQKISQYPAYLELLKKPPVPIHD